MSNLPENLLVDLSNFYQFSVSAGAINVVCVYVYVCVMKQSEKRMIKLTTCLQKIMPRLHHYNEVHNRH